MKTWERLLCPFEGHMKNLGFSKLEMGNSIIYNHSKQYFELYLFIQYLK